MFQGNLDFHYQELAKHTDNNQDTSLLTTRYPDNWAVLMDKGYQGAQQYVSAIIPQKTH